MRSRSLFFPLPHCCRGFPGEACLPLACQSSARPGTGDLAGWASALSGDRASSWVPGCWIPLSRAGSDGQVISPAQSNWGLAGFPCLCSLGMVCFLDHLGISHLIRSLPLPGPRVSAVPWSFPFFLSVAHRFGFLKTAIFVLPKSFGFEIYGIGIKLTGR